MKQTERIAHWHNRMMALGLSFDEVAALRRIEMTLSRWHELECGDGNDYASWAIERDEATDKPFMVTYPHDGKERRRPIADRETGAHKRLAVIMARHPELWSYVQGDPRGCALYVGRPDDLRGLLVDQVYYRGVACNY